MPTGARFGPATGKGAKSWCFFSKLNYPKNPDPDTPGACFTGGF